MLARPTDRLLLGLLTLLGATVLGWLVVKQPALASVAVVGLLLLWAALEPKMRPILIGVLFLAYMNVIPFIDLVVLRLPGGIRFDDVIMFGVVLLGAIWTQGSNRRSPFGRLRLALLALGAYWLVVWVQTISLGDGTPLLSALYGRDLLAMTMSIGIASMSSRERDAQVLVGTIVAGACLFSLAHIAQFALGLDTSVITHPYMVGEAVGTARIYSKAQSLVVPAVVLALGQAVVTSRAGVRLWYSAAAAILVTEILIEFTRANYLGLLLAMVVGAIIIARTWTDRPHSRAAVTLVSLGTASLVAWLAFGTQTVRTAISHSAVTARAISASADVAGQGGTFGYRLRLYETMLGVLGDRWLLGLGFWHPSEHYVALLPQGSIRNNDTGVLAIIMTMGLIGIVLFVTPLVMVARWGIKALRSEESWVRAIAWATVTYVVWVAATSFSLGFLAHGGGLASTAVIVGLMAGARQSWYETQDTEVGE